jgi:CsoR family transcriptional regulator, copper-sensing transcriptional repressor
MNTTYRKKEVLLRLKRIEGQVRGLQKMIEQEAGCADILTQVAAVTAAMKKVGMTVVQTFMDECLQKTEQGAKNSDAMRDLQKAISRYISST